MTLTQLSSLRLFVFCLLAMALFAVPAYADVLNLTPNALTCAAGKPSTLNFFTNTANSSNANASADAQIGACGGDSITRFICIMESTLGLVIATFFCHLQEAWLTPLAALVMMFMAVSGIMFTFGLLEFSVKDMAVMLGKMALVVTFALNTDIALNIAFKGFLALTQGTVSILTDVFTAEATQRAAASAGQSGNAPPLPLATMAQGDAHLKGLVTERATAGCSYTGIGGLALFLLTVVIFLVVVSLFLPLIAILVLKGIISGFMFFARAASGYLFSLIMLTFLIAVMPVFVSMALFEKTRSLFDSWVKALFTNSLQIIIVFAFLAFAGSMALFDFIGEVGRVMTNWNLSVGYGWFSLNVGSACSICKPNMVPGPHGMLVIAANPNQCKTPVEGLPWVDILQQTDFLIYLVAQAATVYVIMTVLQDFMQEVPEWGQKLGGASLGFMIGGATMRGGNVGANSLQIPGLTSATFNFEKGFAQAFDQSALAEEKGIRNWAAARLSPMRFATALKGGAKAMVYGASDHSKIDRDAMNKQRRDGISNAKQKVLKKKTEIERGEISVEKLEKAKKEHQQELEAAQRKIDDLRAEKEALKLKVQGTDDSLLKLTQDSILGTQKSLLESDQRMAGLKAEQQEKLARLKAVNGMEGKTPEKERERKAELEELVQKTQQLQTQMDREKATRRELDQELKGLMEQRNQLMGGGYDSAALANIEAQRERLYGLIAEGKNSPEVQAELSRLWQERDILNDKLYDIRQLSLKEFELEKEQLNLQQLQLAMSEADVKLSKELVTLSATENAMKEAEQNLAEWQRVTSDARFARGDIALAVDRDGNIDMDRTEIGYHGGWLGGIWHEKENAALLHREEHRKKAWQSLMHMGDD